MKLTKILFRNPIEKIAITTIVLYVLLILSLVGFPFMEYFNTKAKPLEFDTNPAQIESIEMVNWFETYEPKNYLIYKVLEPQEFPELLNSLSKLEYKPEFGEPHGYRGDCYRIRYNNASVTFVCDTGMARFNVFDNQTERSLNLNANGKQFKSLWESTLNP